MKNLIIVGAGGFGREIFDWVQATGAYKIKGFLDDRPQALEGFNISAPVLGAIEGYEPNLEDVFIVALGDGKKRVMIMNRLMQKGGKMVSLIHTSAYVSTKAKLSDGCIIFPGCYIAAFSQIGAGVVLNFNASVGHDALIGDGCTLNSHVDVTGNVTLGKNVVMGSHSVVLPGLSIVDEVVIGAGSVVLRSIREKSTVMGVPAKRIF